MGGMEDTYIKETEGHLVHTYNRFPVVLERGEGLMISPFLFSMLVIFGAP